MENKKMINTAKNFDIFARVGGKISAGLGIACIILALFTLIFGGKMFTDGAITLDLDFIKFHLNDNAYVNERFMKLYVCITACIFRFIGAMIPLASVQTFRYNRCDVPLHRCT